MTEQEYLGSVKPTREEIQSTLRDNALLEVGRQLGMVEVMRYQAIARAERERMLKIFASFGKIQLKKPLSGKEFEALFD